jgi:uncharacterized NAD(P)/FAD-binding protein YdhS
LTGSVQQSLPLMDSSTQTQTIAIKVNSSHPIPQNLVANVKIIKRQSATASTLPKAAILANETQSEFWVMKMIDDSTAVKIPVKKGIETKDKVQITSPTFTPTDKILVSGNFGLADTAKVIIQH